MMNFHQYINLVHSYIEEKRGSALSRMLTYQDTEHATSEIIMNEVNQNYINSRINPNWSQIVFGHIHCCFLLFNGDYINAYKEQCNCVALLSKGLAVMKEENWMAPVICLMARDLRLLAIAADIQNAHKNSGKSREGLYIPNEYLEKAAEPLMALFRAVCTDNRTSIDRTKRVAMMNLINQLFKIYFRVNKLHLCRPLIRALDSSTNMMDSFTKAQKVTYYYYLGMKNMFDSDYKTADELLSYSFANCHPKSLKNKRLILIFLIPVKMLLGVMPTQQLLEKYHLLPFAPIARAVKQGNLSDLVNALETYSDFFWKFGIYLILDKLKIIAYRNAFKKVCLIMKTHQVPIEAFRVILKFLRKEDVSIEEVNCILANLIFEGKIKGYISLAHQKLVVSKQNPFPPLTQTS
ncbi:PCI domain-containing protein 2-like [Panonychus citri]|uniref:PCI domain-containing protein 2-like n=1 Tax=Panonychus citri TaxID=50023 RepID=UPI002307FD94|nr:PCI domain-containing protein 2-like [Panonychus citri]